MRKMHGVRRLGARGNNECCLMRMGAWGSASIANFVVSVSFSSVILSCNALELELNFPNTQAHLQESYNAQGHNQETFIAQSLLKETSTAQTHMKETFNAQSQLKETFNAQARSQKTYFVYK